MNLMLLAAGEGTRLRPYTLSKPKPAIPFLGLPLAAHSLSFTDSMKIQNLVVNTFHLPKEIHQLFKEIPVFAKNLIFSDEVGQIQDTGGGLGKARSHLHKKGDFFLMNADEVILPDQEDAVEQAVRLHQNKNALATLFVMDHPGVGTEFGGVWTDQDNQVLGFGKTPFLKAKKAWHFIGAQILSDRVFDYIPSGPSNILYGPLTDAIAKGETVQIFPLPNCRWFETGNPTSFLEANRSCLEILADKENSPQKRKLLSTFESYAHVEFVLEKRPGGILWKAINATVPDSTEIVGFAVAGPESKVGFKCRLENIVLNKKATIADGSILNNQIVL